MILGHRYLQFIEIDRLEYAGPVYGVYCFFDNHEIGDLIVNIHFRRGMGLPLYYRNASPCSLLRKSFKNV